VHNNQKVGIVACSTVHAPFGLCVVFLTSQGERTGNEAEKITTELTNQRVTTREKLKGED
jgi:hypothetical protein